MRAVGEADRGRGAADLLERDAVGEVAHAGAAVLLGHGDPEQAERAELLPQIGRELVVRVDPCRPRRDLLGREAPHHGAQSLDLLAKAEAHHRVVHLASSLLR